MVNGGGAAGLYRSWGGAPGSSMAEDLLEAQVAAALARFDLRRRFFRS